MAEKAASSEIPQEIQHAFFVANTNDLVVQCGEVCHILELQNSHGVEPKASCHLHASDVILLSKSSQSAIVAYVTSSLPKRVQLHHSWSDTPLGGLEFPSPLLALVLHEELAAVASEDAIWLYRLQDFLLFRNFSQRLGDLPCPQWGLLALCDVRGRCSRVAFPGSTQEGLVYHYDLHLRKTVSSHGTPVHADALACLTFSHDGRLLASASRRGTVICVWEVPSFRKLHEFRRGTLTSADIQVMTFDPYNNLLAVLSDKATVHIFSLAERGRAATSGGGGSSEVEVDEAEVGVSGQGWLGWMGSAAASALTYVGLDFLVLQRAHAWVYLPDSMAACRKYARFVVWEDQWFLYVVTQDGTLFSFRVPVARGGVMDLQRKIALPLS